MALPWWKYINCGKGRLFPESKIDVAGVAQPRRRSFAKYGGADAHQGCAFFNRNGEIVAQARRKLRKRVANLLFFETPDEMSARSRVPQWDFCARLLDAALAKVSILLR